MTNSLYYGDNLDILRRYFKDESVDLVYLDPPFNSNATYNVLFAEQDGKRAAAQIKAFEDTWQWDQSAAEAYMDVIESSNRSVADAMIAFRTFLGDTNMLAYLAMMAPRLIELRRVLKPTGSIYLHCDPTASHYLKMLLDAVFGVDRFLNEIIWKRTTSHGNVARNYGSINDNILFYAKGPDHTWVQQYTPFPEDYIREKFTGQDAKGRYQNVTLRNPGVRPNLHYPYTASNGVTYQPHPNGWSCDIKRMRQYDAEGRLHFPAKPTGQLRLKMHLHEAKGVRMQNIWDDIPAINSQAQERLGYPTQKPEALLERIIKSSSNEGDVVLDPFCGCGTAIAAAQKLQRRWVGIDITHLAVTLIKHRLQDTFGKDAIYAVIGEPVSAHDAQALADQDKYQFQWWALGLVGARPTEQKKGADRGIDGRLYFHDDESGKTKQIILSVKGGNVTVAALRDLRGVVDREKAAIGVLITMEPITKPMKAETASAGFYESIEWGKFPRLQAYTVAELLTGETIKYPPTRAHATFKKAAKHQGPVAKSGSLDFDADDSN